MAHNLTVTVDDELWEAMRKHNDIRWSAVMKQAAKEKIEALKILNALTKKTALSEKQIEALSVKIGKRVSHRA